MSSPFSTDSYDAYRARQIADITAENAARDVADHKHFMESQRLWTLEANERHFGQHGKESASTGGGVPALVKLLLLLTAVWWVAEQIFSKPTALYIMLSLGGVCLAVAAFVMWRVTLVFVFMLVAVWWLGQSFVAPAHKLQDIAQTGQRHPKAGKQLPDTRKVRPLVDSPNNR